MGSWAAVEAWLDGRGLRWRRDGGRLWVTGGVDCPAVLSDAERGELARLCARARGEDGAPNARAYGLERGANAGQSSQGARL